MKKTKTLFFPIVAAVSIFLGVTYLVNYGGDKAEFIKNVFAERDREDNNSRDDNKRNKDKKDDANYNSDNQDDKKKRITVPSSDKNKEERRKEEPKKEESKKTETKKTNTRKEEVKEKKVIIETKDDTAKKVEFYIKKEEGNQDVYLGNAEKNSADNNWELGVNVDERIPNGDYILNAEIEDEEGKWKSEEVKVQVDLGLSNKTEEIVEEAVTEKEKGDKEKKKEEQKEEKKQNEFAYDWDMDGISDEEEARLGTDQYAADSDQDGYLDSDEIKNGFDPLKYSPGDKSDKIVFEEPKEKGELDDKYAVKEVKKETKREGTDAGKNRISFAGKALPNSFVTLYIYSEKPIIVTVKTDIDGNWTYDLDKELEDGNHEVYVAVTDNTGKVTAKSNPLKFIKTAQAVEMDSLIIENNKSPLEKGKMGMLAYAVAIILTGIGLALVIISIVVRKKSNGNKEIN